MIASIGPRPQAGVGKLKHAPPLLVAQALSPANQIFSQLLTVAALAIITVSPTNPILAQTPPQNFAVSGVVKDTTGQPLANYSVSTEVNATWVNATIVQSRDT